jgi:hypothetical protein
VNNTGTDERSKSEALTQAQARSRAETESTETSAARTHEAVAGASRQDRAAQTAQGEPASDSAERCRQLAETLEGKGKGKGKGKGAREAVSSRLLADKHQGASPTAAAAQKPSLAKTSKLATQRVQGKALERRGLER